MKENKREFPCAAELIRIEMVRCGYTLETLSARTEVSPMVLRGILTGRTTAISTRCLYALAVAFGYSMADFIDLLSGNLGPGNGER